MAGREGREGEGARGGTSAVWFRRDLRLHDHPALTAAIADGERIAPLFVFDETLLRGRWPAPNRLWFMREAVRSLGEGLRERGGGLAIRVGRPEEVVPTFAAEVGARAVSVTRDYGPYARGRDRRVAAALAGAGVRFAAKRGLTDYRVGEAHFMAHLTDGDLASNNGGWQWAASVGTDAQPYFRVFNPPLQGRRYDPAGDSVRRWVPELAGVPTRYIHEPWTMPPEVQREAGCVIGTDYPAPIVDHAAARQRALDAFKEASGKCVGDWASGPVGQLNWRHGDTEGCGGRRWV